MSENVLIIYPHDDAQTFDGWRSKPWLHGRGIYRARLDCHVGDDPPREVESVLIGTNIRRRFGTGETGLDVPRKRADQQRMPAYTSSVAARLDTSEPYLFQRLKS